MMRKKRFMQWTVLMFLPILCTACGNTKNHQNTISNAKETEVVTPIAVNTTQEAQPTRYGGMEISKVADYFQRTKEIFDQDNGAMWGKKLVEHIMMVNAETNEIISNEQSKSGLFKQVGDVYVGQLPKDTIVSCSTLDFDGEKWATVLSNYTEEDKEMLDTCVHELFHLNEPLLGMQDFLYDNSHMDELDARVDLKVEWNALEMAVHSEGEERKEHIQAALAFRKDRREKFNSAKDENAFEVMEGMAEYTADRLVYGEDGVKDNRIPYYKKDMLDEGSTPSLCRSFGYYSGLLYGTLLDEYSTDWRIGMTVESDLGELLRDRAGITSDVDVKSVRDNYDYDNIYHYEENRKERLDKRNDKLVKQLVKGHILTMNFGGGMNFDPGCTWKLFDYGTIYYSFESSGDWGNFKGGNTSPVLLKEDWSAFSVNVDGMKQKGSVISGNGWTLELTDGYTLKEVGDGNYEISQDVSSK